MNDDLRWDGPDELPDQRDPTAALLSAVLHREADAVTPSPDGYVRIRAAIGRQPARRRPGRVRAFMPVLAAAAALVVIAAAGSAVVRSVSHRSDAPTDVTVALRAAEQNDVAATPDATLPVYVPARQNGRIVLFREFRREPVRGDAAAQVEAAVRLALVTEPREGDHVRLFAKATPTVRATVTDRLVTVDISPAPRAASGTPTQEEATAAVQQLVWTATAAAAVATTTPATTVSPSAKVPAGPAATPARSVRLTLGGRSGEALFGLVALDRTFDRRFGGDPRARAWVIDPGEGSSLRAGTLQASGDALADDGKVHLVLVHGGRAVWEQDVPLTPPAGSTGPLKPGQRGAWKVTGLDVSAPGAYSLEVTITDAEGRIWSDSTTFTTG